MSDPDTQDKKSQRSQGSRKATVVRVIRSNEKAPPAPATKRPKDAAVFFNDTATTEKANRSAKVETTPKKPVKKTVQRATRRFRDFETHNGRAAQQPTGEKRMARGPHFPFGLQLRVASVFYIVARLCIIATIVALIALAMDKEINILFLTIPPAGAIVFGFIAWGMSNGLRCRVCTMPFLSKRKCKMSTKAPKLPLVSHHFTLAANVLVHSHPRCPYCGTINRLKK